MTYKKYIIMKRKYEELNNDSDICPICLGNIGNKNLTITKCGHKFCHNCLDTHSCKDNKCPICREDMETKIKNKDICPCCIRHCITKSLNESNHYCNNLCKRINKKFIELLLDHQFLDKDFKNNEEINKIKEKMCEKLSESEEFKMEAIEFLYKEIIIFSFNNSKNSCYYLKSLLESE